MKRTLVLMLVVLFLSGALLSAESLEGVLKKNYAARGGLDKIKAVKTTIMEGIGNRMGTEFPIKIIVKNPSKNYMEAEFMGTKIIRAYNGKTAWWIMPLMGVNDPTPMPEDQAKEVVESAENSDPLVYYKERGHKLELMGKEDMEGTEVYKIKMTNKDSKKVTLFFLDADSGIELKVSSYMKEGETEYLVDALMSDYQEVEGMMVPFQIQQKANGQLAMTLTFKSCKFNQPVEDSLFDMPAKKEVAAEPAKK